MAEEIVKRRPDYLVIFPDWFPNLSLDPRFRPLHMITVRDNITMGGDEVVVFIDVDDIEQALELAVL